MTLYDTIVYFGEKVGEGELAAAQEQSRKADLAICVGSSLKVLQHYKYIWEQAPAAERSGGAKKQVSEQHPIYALRVSVGATNILFLT